MLSLIKRYREPLIVLALLLYPFGMFLTHGRKGRDPNMLDRAVLAATAPVQSALSRGVDGLTGTWRGYIGLRGVKQENLALKTENAQLRQQVNDLGEARTENERLKRMLAYAESNPGRKLPSRVLGVNPVSTFISLRIDRGENDGVQQGMPVVTPDGVVGQVYRCTGGYSDVVLINDPNSRVGVRIQRSRVRATAAGAGGNQSLKLDNALRTEDVQEGDTVITSGADGVFPPGLVVGRVTALQKRGTGMFQGAEIIPSVDATKLEEVFVLLTSDSPAPLISVPYGGPAPETRP